VSGYQDPFRPSRVAYVARAAAALAREPYEAKEKAAEKLAARLEQSRHGGTLVPPTGTYVALPDWERRLHELCGAPWPCPQAADFRALWPRIVDTMSAAGLRTGRQNYGEDDDGDAGLVRAAWCLTCHLAADTVIETGVGHGVSSRGILEAMAVNGNGHLWSIDLPPFTIFSRSSEIGAAVTPDLRPRWSYLRGSSRRVLPSLLGKLRDVDLFVHDSRHSTRNVLYECESAFQALRPGGFLLVDDLDGNRGFAKFTANNPEVISVVAVADDGQRFFGLAQKRRGVSCTGL
jgi:Methyltransferase domain